MNQYNGYSPSQRLKAQKWLNEQWKTGKAQRPSMCCACGQTRGVIHAHAENYSEPFGEHIYKYPLCYRCHMMLHCRFQNPLAWNDYKAELKKGALWNPMYWPDFDEIKETMLGKSKPIGFASPRVNLVFEKMKI